MDLIDAVQNANPNLILMTGDMLNRDASPDELQRLLKLVEKLSEIAPVYYSLGNHELDYMETCGSEFLASLQSVGAAVLEQSYEDIDINGQTVRVGGAYGYLLSHKYRNESEQAFMDEFTDTDLPTILLAHMSEGLLAYHCAEEWDVDYVFSGHAHGGQVRLPLIGGLYDPEIGWFPKYSKGMFEIGDTTIILSAGLGDTDRRTPRFFNPPEVITFTVAEHRSNP